MAHFTQWYFHELVEQYVLVRNLKKQNAQSDPGGVLPVRHCNHFGRIYPPKMVERSLRQGGGGSGGGGGGGGGRAGGGGGGIFQKRKW